MITDKQVAAALLAWGREFMSDEETAMRAALEAAERAAWQPIAETPPPGGGFFLVWSSDLLHRARPHSAHATYLFERHDLGAPSYSAHAAGRIGVTIHLAAWPTPGRKGPCTFPGRTINSGVRQRSAVEKPHLPERRHIAMGLTDADQLSRLRDALRRPWHGHRTPPERRIRHGTILAILLDYARIYEQGRDVCSILPSDTSFIAFLPHAVTRIATMADDGADGMIPARCRRAGAR